MKLFLLPIDVLTLLGVTLSTPASQKKTYGRPKSAEPGSPLLRRALSPDRLHPRSAENKKSISPLANSLVRVTPRVTIAQASLPESGDEISASTADTSIRESNESKIEKKPPVNDQKTSEYSKLTHGICINIQTSVGISNSCGSTQLPRIAEEKDSPTGSKSEDYSKDICDKISVFESKLLTSEKIKKNDESMDSSSGASSMTSVKESVQETKSYFTKSKMDVSPETRKILKRYKVDGQENSGAMRKFDRSFSTEDKKNK